MSIIGTKVYSDYNLTQEIPQWAKLERYEYCEPFFDTIDTNTTDYKKRLQSFVRTLASLFL